MPRTKNFRTDYQPEQTATLFEESEAEPRQADGLPLAERPLADRLRPRTLDEFVGQEKIIGQGRALRRMIEEDRLQSLIFWGPPGTGKTTLAHIIAQSTAARFVPFSAVLSGIREVREVMSEAEVFRRKTNRRTVIFVDEIHRFNKAQQDAFLPFVESGAILLIGATTENPSFEINSALLSRSKVFVLEQLASESLVMILQRALADDERGFGAQGVQADDDVLRALAIYASGDARTALNTLELAASIAESDSSGAKRVTFAVLKEAMQRAMLAYDKTGEEHFNLISAFIKSIRNSDADAAVYWLARMIEAGEDPLFIARRLVHHASEDIGLADPAALVQTVAAMQATHFIGLPEARLALTQATIYLARAPKSNAVLRAYLAAQKDALETEREPVPLHLRNAPTGLMKGLGYGKDYQYAHDYPSGRAEAMACLPENLRGKKYYEEKTEGESQNSEFKKRE